MLRNGKNNNKLQFKLKNSDVYVTPMREPLLSEIFYMNYSYAYISFESPFNMENYLYFNNEKKCVKDE